MRSGRIGYVFIAPALLHLFVFALFPLLYTLYVSFFKWNLIRDERQFIGLENYRYSFEDPLFWNAMWNSFRYAAVSVPLGMAVGLAVAVLVAQKIRGVTLFRTIYYIPAISSGVAISMLWIYMYLPETGLLNTMLSGLGLSDGSTDWLNQEATAMWALVFMSVWIGLGPKMILFLAGLMGIPPSLYEAAEIDGASRWKTFWTITLPMLVPTTFFVLVTSTIAAFQIFTPVYMMTRGGPNDSTDVVGFHIYNEAWVKFLVGIASAKSFVLLAAILIVAILQFRLMRRQLEGYSVT
jgi:multiple sugar transport system permease protein